MAEEKPDATRPRGSDAAKGSSAESPEARRASERRSFDLRMEEASLTMQIAAIKLRQLEDDAYRFLSPEESDELQRDLEAVSQRLPDFKRRCTYCRHEMISVLGICAVCGRDVCSDCGQLTGDAVLHRGNCVAFYEQQGAEREPEQASEEAEPEPEPPSKGRRGPL